ncbi:hypothetical protein BH10PSE3_BH10PSE3_27430 [soil metagenome]
MTHACAAGVDVGRDWLDVGLAPSGKTFQIANAPAGIATLVARLKREGISKVVLESIGGYGARLVRGLAEAGLEVGVVDPKRIAALRTAEGRRAKTDRLDAGLIARFALLMQDAARPVPDAPPVTTRASGASIWPCERLENPPRSPASPSPERSSSPPTACSSQASPGKNPLDPTQSPAFAGMSGSKIKQKGPGSLPGISAVTRKRKPYLPAAVRASISSGTTVL